MVRFRISSIFLALFSWTHGALSAEVVRVVSKDVMLEARQPQAAVGSDGTIYITFAYRENFYCSASTNGGKSYGVPVSVGQIRRLRLGYRKGPRIAASSAVVVITAMGRAAEILAWRSADRGKTWQGPTSVTDAPDVSKQGYHAMAAGRDGQLFCVWLDQRGQIRNHNRIFGAGSNDSGKTWSEDRLIYESPDGFVCPCCQPTVAYDADGAICVLWRNNLDGCRDFYLTISNDGGKTFGKSVKQGLGSWKLKVCPMDGGGLAVIAPGKTATVWQRQNQIFRVDAGTNEEQLIGPGVLPWGVGTKQGAYFVWVTKRNNNLWLMSPAASKPTKLALRANDPMIAASPSGDGPVVAVWEAGPRGSRTVFAAVVADNNDWERP